MSRSMPVGLAREQLHELIAILGELRNAGPRDQSFKQWRQVTLTLIQRIWPGEPRRAARFRDILFSAPTSRSDPAATREYFERGCREASAYLEELALELEESSAPAPAPAPGEAGATEESAAPAEVPTPAESPAPPAASIAPGPPTPSTAPAVPATSAPVQPADLPSVSSGGDALVAPQEDPAAALRPRLRLKDMLGFGDAPESATPRGGRSEADVPGMQGTKSATPRPVVPAEPQASAATTPDAAARIPSPPAASPPIRAAVPPPSAPAVPPATPPPSMAPAPFAFEDADPGAEDEVDQAVEEELDAALEELESRVEHPIRGPRPDTPTLPAREVLAMAAMVEELGIPAQRRAIVRAALIDLARQMDAPPVHWQTVRQTLSFVMDHPQLARRVLPLLLPHLDQAA